jgi:hypothetical protein
VWNVLDDSANPHKSLCVPPSVVFRHVHGVPLVCVRVLVYVSTCVIRVRNLDYVLLLSVVY